jgi:hypothetical protein
MSGVKAVTSSERSLMSGQKGQYLKRIGVALVSLMALLQAVYAIYAYLDPQAFALLRGTELFVPDDADWVKIYASRTMFVALIIGFLLIIREYNILVWASLFGTVMPATDAFLAYQAGAESVVVYKHLATVVYLLITFSVLKIVVKNKKSSMHPE